MHGECPRLKSRLVSFAPHTAQERPFIEFLVPVSTTGVVPSDGWVTLSDTEIPQASSLQSDAEQEQEQEQSTAEEAGFVERSPPASRRASPERDPAPPQPIQNESVQETDADMTDAADARTVEVVLGQQNPGKLLCELRPALPTSPQ